MRATNPNDGASGAVLLLKADLVMPGDDFPLVEGQVVVEKSAAERKQLHRRRAFLMLGLIMVATGITAGVTLGITSRRSNRPVLTLPSASPLLSLAPSSLPSSSPSVHPSSVPSASTAPSGAPSLRPNIRSFLDSLPNITAQSAVGDRFPPSLGVPMAYLLDVWKL